MPAMLSRSKNRRQMSITSFLGLGLEKPWSPNRSPTTTNLDLGVYYPIKVGDGEEYYNIAGTTQTYLQLNNKPSYLVTPLNNPTEFVYPSRLPINYSSDDPTYIYRSIREVYRIREIIYICYMLYDNYFLTSFFEDNDGVIERPNRN